MNKNLKTPLYNKLYYDFLNSSNNVHNYLPVFKTTNWSEISKSILNQSPVYSEIKDVIYNDNFDLDSEKAKCNLGYLKQENTIFIITGQQLGLFASPLYTIYKIITSIKLAEQLNSQNLGFKFVPLFWLESEDHDFKEINHFGIWDKKFQTNIIRYNGEDREKVSIKHYSFEQEIEDLILLLEQELIPTEFSGVLFDKIKKWFKKGESWLLTSREILKDIFNETGLLFFKPGHQHIKNMSKLFFLTVLKNCEELNIQFKNMSQNLEENGYPNQVTVVEGKTFLFLEDENLNREHIYYNNDYFYTKDSDKQFTKDDLCEILNKSPEKFSTSVVSRPLLQSWLLPTAAYIAGPGEIAYWAQISGMFDQMKLKMPIVYPRISATILEPKIQRYVKKYSLNIENISKKQNEFIKQYLSARSDSAFLDSKSVITTELEKLKQKILSIDHTLENLFKKTTEKIQNQIDFLEHKTLKAKEQKEQNLISHLKQIHSAFFPDGLPQERYLTFIYFINKFGPDILETVFKELDHENFEHQIINI